MVSDDDVPRPRLTVTHMRVVAQTFSEAEVEAILAAELIRRAKVHGIIVSLNNGNTKVVTDWDHPDDHRVMIEIHEDLIPGDQESAT